ncbi:MAG: O-antigen ligase family protein [Candidatus Omnitrophica bacterium]|nr:O-antigen ligase family protein [Candidatus Omnitrophota bacterium]
MKPGEVGLSKKQNSAYVWLGVFVLILAYIVTKEVSLPTGVLVGAAIIGGLFLLFKGISKPEIVTYVLVAYIPFSKILPGDFGGLAVAFNMTNLLMFFIILVWLSGRYSAGEPLWCPSPLNLPIILFIMLGALAVMRGISYGPGYLSYTLTGFKRWMTPIVLYFLVLNTVKDKENIRNVVITMMIVCTIVGLMATWDYMNIGEVSDLEKARIGGISDHSNSLAAFFNYYMFLPFGFFLLNMHRPRYWLLLIPFLICFRGIMVTFSRGGYLAFALGLYAITFFRSKILFVLLLLATLVIYANPILLPAGIRYRMGQTYEKHTYGDEYSTENLEASSKNRVEVWKGALEMIAEHPFFGVGYGLFLPMIRFYWSGGTPIDAHNTYLIIGAEMGLPTLFIFLLIIAMAIWYSRKLYLISSDHFSRAVALGFLGGLFGLLMSNMFGSRLDSQEISGYFWILCALIMRLLMIEKKKPLEYANTEESQKNAQVIHRQKKLDSIWFEEDQKP